ncbi:hypothetical protein LCGC14_1198830 [marine sediment metagenome]|uniref:Uncharacterized protein n=1 Tax=marine sediment metagenome TaxID=412755 RepID=A0A0F9NZZ7_9ZZZZ
MILRIRELVTLDEKLIEKARRRMMMGLQLGGHRNVSTEVVRFKNTNDAEITAWGER